jgi:hypothetical protein
MTLPLSAALKDLEARLGKPVVEEEEIRLYGGVMFGAIPAEVGNNGRTRKMINKIVGALSLCSFFDAAAAGTCLGVAHGTACIGAVRRCAALCCAVSPFFFLLMLARWLFKCHPGLTLPSLPHSHHHPLYLASSRRMAWRVSKPAPAWPCPPITLIEWHPLRAWKSYRSCPCPATF